MSDQVTIILPGTIGGHTVTRIIDVRIGAIGIGHIITGATIELLEASIHVFQCGDSSRDTKRSSHSVRAGGNPNIDRAYSARKGSKR
jgi:hypothetical protein